MRAERWLIEELDGHLPPVTPGVQAVAGWVPWEEADSETGPAGCLLGGAHGTSTHGGGQGGSRSGKRENRRWDTDQEKGWSGFSEHVKLEVIGWTFIPLGQSVTGCGLPWKGASLGRGDASAEAIPKGDCPSRLVSG